VNQKTEDRRLKTIEPIIVLGVMSGTSLDGLDLALCRFLCENGKWEYEILLCATLPYDPSWKNKLQDAMSLKDNQLALLDSEYGEYIGTKAKEFLMGSGMNAELIASHGHTIFHRPEAGITYQAGNGARIASITGIPTVCDFRKKDVELGGQGAPLVPVGDELLFGHYDYCLNLGGFANISFDQGGTRLAFDICPVNIILNELAAQKGLEYDHNGHLGKKGSVNKALLDRLNNLEYYGNKYPKSLGREWLNSSFRPLLNETQIPVSDLSRTIYEHIAWQVGRIPGPGKKVLVTGGGVYNPFLMELIRQDTSAILHVPDDQLVQYKEAMVFGLLGLLRWRNEINCYSSVTGASLDSSTGTVYL
jgi:anhydro-N-acetylmuramic acid kinase